MFGLQCSVFSVQCSVFSWAGVVPDNRQTDNQHLTTENRQLTTGNCSSALRCRRPVALEVAGDLVLDLQRQVYGVGEQPVADVHFAAMAGAGLSQRQQATGQFHPLVIAISQEEAVKCHLNAAEAGAVIVEAGHAARPQQPQPARRSSVIRRTSWTASITTAEKVSPAACAAANAWALVAIRKSMPPGSTPCSRRLRLTVSNWPGK